MEVDESIILEQDAFRGLCEGLSVASHASDGGYRQHLKKIQCGCVGDNYGFDLYYYIFRLVLGGLC